jgi:RNAse (barnase) inhibitor barstar
MGKRVRQIELDATGWLNADDFYSTLLPALGAPSWHGRNMDALLDTLTEVARYGVETTINTVQPPFGVTVRNASAAPAEIHQLLQRLQRVFDLANSEYALGLSLTIRETSDADRT